MRTRNIVLNVFQHKNIWRLIFFIIILGIGVFARIWQYSQLPSGLNQDEASTGVDAHSLLHFGVDQNGISYPVHFISFGSGTPAFYGYLTIPSVAIFGLSPFAVRLPMLIVSLCTLPLVYFLGKRIIDEELAFIAMFFVAISPWHIMLSRWGLDVNTLPFVFTLGFVLLLKSSHENQWAIPAFGVLALSLYTYGSAYAAVPIFMSIAIPTLLILKRIKVSTLIFSLLVFLIVAIPISLVVVINFFNLDTIHLGVVTIPRMSTTARFISQTSLFSNNFWQATFDNFKIELLILIKQSDGTIYNTVDKYGYFYIYTTPFIALGVAHLIPWRKSQLKAEKLLLLAWIFAAFCIGLIEPININRINLIFIPLILSAAIVVHWFWKQAKYIGIFILVCFLIGFGLFSRDYHSDVYRQQIGDAFFEGFIPALQYAQKYSPLPICVTDKVNMPYIYVLFTEKLDPAKYLQNIRYADTQNEYRNVLSLENFTFGIKNCPSDNHMIYILKDETPPAVLSNKEPIDFGEFHVYLP